MSIFNLKYIRELQINGKDIEDEEDDNFEVNGADKRKRAPRQQPQEEPEENTNFENEDDDDFTMDEEDMGEDDTQNKEDTSNTNEEEPEEDQSEDDAGNDDDFTMDGSEGDDPDSGEGGEEGSEEDTGEDSDTEGGEDTGEQEAPTDDKQAAESEIYESLSDEQKRIRIMKLKLDYKDLYETMINSIEGINQIPITVDNAESIKRLNILLNRSKTILISYIRNNFDQNTYMENYTNYIKYLSIFRTASMVIEELTNHKNANNR